MISREDRRIVWGILLVLAGLFLFARNLGVIDPEQWFSENVWAYLSALFFVGLSVLFLFYFTLDQENWWAAIPGFTLLGLGAGFLIDRFFPSGDFSGTLLLLGVSSGFLAVYLRKRDQWWAIIPWGVVGTIAITAAIPGSEERDSGPVFFAGLGLTFALVALAPTPEGRMTWAWIPATILLGLSFLIAFSLESLLTFVWPLLLVLFGGAILFRRLTGRTSN